MNFIRTIKYFLYKIKQKKNFQTKKKKNFETSFVGKPIKQHKYCNKNFETIIREKYLKRAKGMHEMKIIENIHEKLHI